MISSLREPVDSRHAHQSFDAADGSVRRAREFALNTLADWGLPGCSEDVRLCVSEIVTNAVKHGTRPGHGFLVTIIAGDFLRLEVQDSCPSQPEVQDPTESDPEGRGLLLVEAFSDDWGVEERDPLGKIVWAHFNTGTASSR